MPSGVGRRIVNGLALLVVAAVLVLTLIWLLQRRLIYLPAHDVPSPPPGIEEVTYQSEDGLTLTAWFVAARTDAETGAVIVFNGNAGNRSYRLSLGTALADRGYSVLLTDYRGYGGNPGSPSESGLARDATAAVDYLTSAHDVGADRLVYFGESLGAGVAIGLAIERPAAALILRSPFTSLAEIASVHYPFLPTSLLLRDRYPNLERMARVEAPVMVIAGSNDRIVPLEQSQRVFGAASEPKAMLVVEDAGHNDLALFDGEEMIEGIIDFLDPILGG